MRLTLNRLLLAFAGCLIATLGATQAYGQGGVALDFSTDPEDRGIEFFGDSEWRTGGGVNNSGYLKVTDAANGSRGAIVFPDLSEPAGSSLSSFQITADLRVGAGTDRPADGFSFNLVRPEDPLLETGGGYAASPANENDLPEEGSTTGLGIGFDEWQSGPRSPKGNAYNAFVALGDGEQLTDAQQEVFDTITEEELAYFDANGGECGPETVEVEDFEGELVDGLAFDCIGISVRVDNVLVGQAGFPTLNGELNDQSSLQTGPRGQGLEALGWSQLQIRVTPTDDEGLSNLFIAYKDRVVFDEVITYSPSPGQLVFGGRTGGANANHHIDNINIVTDFDDLTLGDFNSDGSIDLVDYQILLDNMNTGSQDTTFSDGDINFSGGIDLDDFASFRAEYAKANPNGPPLSAVPEPAAALMAIFGFLGIAGFRRRR